MNPHPRAPAALLGLLALVASAAPSPAAAPSADDPCRRVAARAAGARSSFDGALALPLHHQVTTAAEPERSSKSTVVIARTGLATRGLTQTGLARDGLAFVERNAFCTAAGRARATGAVGALDRYLAENGARLCTLAEENLGFLAGELAASHAELATLEERFEAAADPRRRGTLRGRIDLTRLRIAKLDELTVASGELRDAFCPEPPPPPPPPAAVPPWAVQSPGGAGRRLGFGVGVVRERWDDYTTAFDRTEVTTGGETTVLEGDPDFLDRKFASRWQLDAAVFHLPVALPALPLPGSLRLHTALDLRLGVADATFQILDRADPASPTSLEGSGALWGVGVELLLPFAGDRGFAAVGYRHRQLTGLDLERVPGFTDPGFQLRRDRASLERESRFLELRLGYTLPGGRVTPWLGLRDRRSELEVESELELAATTVELITVLESTSRFESEAREWLAGVDARLSDTFYARGEAAFGTGESTVAVKLVYLRGPR